MKKKNGFIAVTCFLTAVGSTWMTVAYAEQTDMSFFVTSVGKGDGGNLGGLEGADAHCVALAKAAGAKRTSWHAYLSTAAVEGKPGIDARDRIGKGPWINASGVTVAQNINDLHSDTNKIDAGTALKENGGTVGRDVHDLLTGSNMDGTVSVEWGTCENWTSNSGGSASVGHHDRFVFNGIQRTQSWNSAHKSRNCSKRGLWDTRGDGLFYCFATD